jgi:hypothetical protein
MGGMMLFWTEGSERVTEGKKNIVAVAVYRPCDDRQLQQNCSSDPSIARSRDLSRSGSHTIIKVKPSINQQTNNGRRLRMGKTRGTTHKTTK